MRKGEIAATDPRPFIWCRLTAFAIATAIFSLLILPRTLGAEETPDEAKAQAHQIAARLPRLRGLTFKTAVPIDVDTPAQARDVMRQETQKENPEEELRNDTAEGVLLGMWPSDFDLLRVSINSDSSDLLAFYSPDTKRMTLIEGDGAASSRVIIDDGRAHSFGYVTTMTIAHELTHALQDQYFDLNRLTKIKHDDDRALAFRAIVEGDATLTGLLYTFKGLDTADARAALTQIINLSAGASQSVSMPDTITMQTGFVYGVGTGFVGNAYKHGGFAAVNKLLRNPPASTHQILNPSLYFDHFTPPQNITIHGYESSLPGWHKVDEDTLGQMLLFATLHETLGDVAGLAPICNSWRGDRFVMLANGDARAMIGFIEFDSRDAASKFAATYAQVLDHAHSYDRAPHLVQAREKTAIVLIGEAASKGPSVSNALWAQTQFGDTRTRTASRAAMPSQLAAARVTN